MKNELMPSSPQNCGPLSDIRVLDLSRILAGPTLTQNLGDMGADIIKIERPGSGDDTRKWGPPDIESSDPQQERWSSYYLCANRNKRSVAIDISKQAGQELVRKLAAKADILVENYKVGGLKKYHLDYASLGPENPRLIYCSITGFGQTGPLSHRPGYDAMIQAMGGIMSITGTADGAPVKVGVGIADVMCGMYGGQAVLAALHHRDRTGEGQFIDLSLFDTQIAWLVNEGLNYLVSDKIPTRRGTAHPNIVPYQVFPTKDGYFMLAVGNDVQFQSFCVCANTPKLALEEKYATNPARVRNRDELIPLVEELTRKQTSKYWLSELEKRGVPCGPLHTIDKSLEHEQTRAREMVVNMRHDMIDDDVKLIANPLKFEKTPVSYRHFPPRRGEHTREVLAMELGLDARTINELQDQYIIEVAKTSKETDQCSS
jgi:crotonobetainyl-CoA:carnitine CoA-transferase CaiB-like acyl-CoA transferase